MGHARGRINFKNRLKRHKKELERLAKKAEGGAAAKPAAKPAAAKA
jgi:hypothetical protein